MAVSFCCRRLQSYIKKRSYQYYCTSSPGYLILLPEIGPNIPDDNILLKDGLPDFSDISPEKCVTALGKTLLDLEHEVFSINNILKRTNEGKTEKAKGDYDFIHNIVQPLQSPGMALDITWGIVKTIFIVDSDKLPSRKYLSLHSRAHKAQYAKFSSKPIFDASKNCDVSKLSEEEQRVLERYQIEGTLSGLGLSEHDNECFDSINLKLFTQKIDFNKRIQVSIDLFDIKIADSYVVRDFPAYLLENMAEGNKDDPTHGPWVASVSRHLSDRFLEYCPDPKIRYRLWMNRMKVASLLQEVQSSELQNSSTLEQIRSHRAEQAKLLGYPNYASMSMETKMAGTLDNVYSVLEYLREQAFPAHVEEIEQLQEFANRSGYKEKLKEPDVPYWARKHKKALYNFENEELRDYFPYDKVLDGLMKFCEKRFGIRFEEVNNVSTWHPDVKVYYLYEDDVVGPVAGFYLDPFTRPEKLKSLPEGGWIVNIRSAAHMTDDPKAFPISSVILNLPPPMYGKPSLLSYSEVKSLFEKFGRLMQQLLCTATYAEVSGLSFVEWDSVDVAAHFMGHCLEEPQVLKTISGHYSTGDELPVRDMRKVSTHMAGTELCSELYKSMLDLQMNTKKDFWLNIVRQIWPRHFVYPLMEEYNEPLSMVDIVTQNSCASYYSNVWSRMIAADLYSAFNEEGADPVVVGTRFRDTYLSFGGGCDPHEIFRRFRGRDPSVESLLRYLKLNDRNKCNEDKV